MNYLGIKDKELSKTVNALNDILANYNVYYQKLRCFHWNIQGENFFDLHVQFEELYNDARLKIDEIAERVLTLRSSPVSTMQEYLDKSEVTEVNDYKDMTDRQMVDQILKDHGILIGKMRTIIDNAGDASDEGTIDMIGGFLSDLEKKSWMLDAWRHRQKPVTSKN